MRLKGLPADVNFRTLICHSSCLWQRQRAVFCAGQKNFTAVTTVYSDCEGKVPFIGRWLACLPRVVG